MPFATLNGMRFHDDTHGEGDHVLLINGLSAPPANWLYPFPTNANRAVLGFLRGVER